MKPRDKIFERFKSNVCKHDRNVEKDHKKQKQKKTVINENKHEQTNRTDDKRRET